MCINAETELEAVGMAWGALATGARAATGSTGQGLSLMQESFSEITARRAAAGRSFNMARGQQDYFQATRGGGHGDYRHIVLAPLDIGEAVELAQLAFHLADKWRNPVLVYGDYLLAHIQEAVAIATIEFPELPPKDWAVDGSRSGRGWSGTSRRSASARSDSSSRPGGQVPVPRHEDAADGARGARRDRLPRRRRDRRRRVRVTRQVREVRVEQLRAEGDRVGYVRPITLWPFPYDAVRDGHRGCAAGRVVRAVGAAR